MESRDGTGDNWKSLSVSLLEAGKFQQLRRLLAKIRLEKNISWENVCKPSQYCWKDGHFIRDKGKGGDYGLLLGVFRNLKRKTDREQNFRIHRDNKVMKQQISDLKTTIDCTRATLSENIQQNLGLRKCLNESNTRLRQLTSRYVDKLVCLILNSITHSWSLFLDTI